MRNKTKSSFRGRVASNSRKQTKATGSSYLQLPNGIPLLMLEEGTRKIKLDFLPYEVTDSKHPDNEDAPVGSLWYRRPFTLHRSVGADNKNYVCLSSIGKKCPICEYQKELFESDKTAAIALYPKPRMLYVVIPIDSDKHEQIPHVWDMSERLFQDILSEELQVDEENEIFPDLEEGKTLEISFKWKSIGDGKAFPEARSIKFEDRDAYDEKILNEVPNLDEVLNVLSYDELHAKFFELDEDVKPEEDQEEDEKIKIKGNNAKNQPLTRRTAKKEEDLNSNEDKDNEEGTNDKSKLKRQTKTTKPIENKINKTNSEPKEKSSMRRETSGANCPNGLKFGIDTDTKDVCDECPEAIWNACKDANEKSNKRK
jgi:hypothetical protein